MRKNSINTRGVIHREVQSGDSAITPANDCYFGNIKMVKKRNGITGKIVVVEGGEICVGGSALASCADLDLVTHSQISEAVITLAGLLSLFWQGNLLDCTFGCCCQFLHVGAGLVCFWKGRCQSSCTIDRHPRKGSSIGRDHHWTNAQGKASIPIATSSHRRRSIG